MNQIDEQLLESIADLHGTPAAELGARQRAAGGCLLCVSDERWALFKGLSQP